MEQMLKIEDLMTIFKVARATIYCWIRVNNFPKPYKIGQQNFWKKSEIEKYLEESKKS